jgi:hypothetical protein
VTLDALVENGSVTGRAVSSLYSIPPGDYTLVWWGIDATVTGSTLSGTIERNQRVIDVQRVNCTSLIDCDYIVTELGTIEHRWRFTATRVP